MLLDDKAEKQLRIARKDAKAEKLIRQRRDDRDESIRRRSELEQQKGAKAA